MTQTPNPETAGFVVTLASGAAVRIDREDHDDIRARGFTNAWFVVGGGRGRSVRAKLPGSRQPVAIARLILGAEDGQRVSYRDGDSLNLRRSNLLLSAIRQPAAVAEVVEEPAPQETRAAASPLTSKRPEGAEESTRIAVAAALPVAPWDPDPQGDAELLPLASLIDADEASAAAEEAPKDRAAVIARARRLHLELPPDIAATLTPAEAAILGRSLVAPTNAVPSLLSYVQGKHPRDLAAQVRLLLDLAETIPAPVPPLPDGLRDAMPRPVRKPSVLSRRNDDDGAGAAFFDDDGLPQEPWDVL